MTSWEWSIPAIIASAGYFHLLLAKELKAFTVLHYFLLGIAALFIGDALFAVHLLADNVELSSQVPTRIAYLLALGSFCFTFLYLVIMGVQYTGGELIKSGRRWQR